jgi:prolyl-tRNA editing enzyme YbaK/EbsC (Cys-tRNA(Pro) deacylase)
MREDGAVMGSLQLVPVLSRLDLVAEPVARALRSWSHVEEVRVAAIDPDLADTAAFCEAYGVGPDVSANCVIVAGKREGEVRYAAAVILATTRADVNGVVRRQLDVRKASFAPMDTAVAETGMAYGGITPVGLPAGWPVLVDASVAGTDEVVIGSGLRGSKLALPGKSLADLPGARVIEGLASRFT